MSKLTGWTSPNHKITASKPVREIELGQPDFPFLSDPVEVDEIGRLANYRVLRLLGSGGMGHVFCAEDIALRRPVALKIMKPEANVDANGWQRFLREARVMAAIKHESLVTVYQAGQEGKTVYLAMELLKGSSLQDWSAIHPRPKFAEIFRLAREIGKGLAVIHHHGLVHRDIKPSNIWLEAPGNRVKILDFGLARFVNDQHALTQSGDILGTPAFMSPEQARGEPVDPRTDLFSFGCVLYQLCTGVDAFQGPNTTAVLTALACQQPRAVRDLNPAIPSGFSELVMRLLEKSPHDRPPSIDAVLEQLRKLTTRSKSTPTSKTVVSPKSSPVKKKKKQSRRWLWPVIGGGAGLIVALAVTVGVLATRTPRPSENGAAVSTQPSPAASPTPVLTYLSDLDPVRIEHWPAVPPPRAGMPPMEPIGGVHVKGKRSPHGIFMHPPPPFDGPARLTYDLGKRYKTFVAEVSFNDGVDGSLFPCTFTVVCDGKPRWSSKPVSSQADSQKCEISVKDVSTLTIEVTCAGEPHGAHAVWIEPRLEK